MKVVISYRRDDTAGVTGRIFDRLISHYGPDSVFMDIDNIPFGLDFREYIKRELGQGDVVLVIMGRHWVGGVSSRRIDDEDDYVRIEVEAALQRGVPVIPVLVDSASMPSPNELPPSIRDLAFRNAAQVDTGRDFHLHVDRLIRSMNKVLNTRELPKPTVATGPVAATAGATLKVANLIAVRMKGADAVESTQRRFAQAFKRISQCGAWTLSTLTAFPWRIALLGGVWLLCLFLTLRLMLSAGLERVERTIAHAESEDKVAIERTVIHLPPSTSPQSER